MISNYRKQSVQTSPTLPGRMQIALSQGEKLLNVMGFLNLHYTIVSMEEVQLSSITSDNERRQRLCPEEEAELESYIRRLQAWGWLLRVEYFRQMATELLEAKGDKKPLGKNWVQKFLIRHSQIKIIYVPPLDKERAKAQDPNLIRDWFELYHRTKKEFDIRDKDT